MFSFRNYSFIKILTFMYPVMGLLISTIFWFIGESGRGFFEGWILFTLACYLILVVALLIVYIIETFSPNVDSESLFQFLKRKWNDK